MDKLSKKEIDILRFIRTSRHKTSVSEIATSLGLPANEVEVLVQGMVGNKFLNRVPAQTPSADTFYTNPELREKIFELLG